MTRNSIAAPSPTVKSDSVLSGPESLPVYSGDWTWIQAAHLLRRMSFAPTYSEIKQSVEDGLEKTIEKLFAPQPEPELPINYYFKDDPEVPIGETWIGKKFTPRINGLLNARNASLEAWIMGLYLDKPVNVLEKLVLFWHNHLVVSLITPPNPKWDYYSLLRKYALGDFKALMKEITINSAMLIYLNGDQNTAKSPNENYARELLELFTIGKGPLIGPGDYTNYTENDIQEIARALTGWGINRRDDKVTFSERKHDTGTKQLSEHFGNATIPNLGEEEYKKVIDIIFEQDEVARFISRQLYIWYVSSNISESVERDVIEPMAQILRKNEYHIEPVLRALCQSEHFFSACNLGNMIKSPIDYTAMLFRTGNVDLPDNLLEKYPYWFAFSRAVNRLDQRPFYLPSVAGWQAYYQEPVYYRYWLSSVSLTQRHDLTSQLVRRRLRGRGLRNAGMDLLGLIAVFDHPEDPNALIRQLSLLFMPFALTDEQYDFLKTDILIPGLPDYEWTEEYGNFIDNPKDENLRKAVLSRLESLMEVMFGMAENQLM